MTNDMGAPETKAELAEAHEDLNTVLAEFRATNDARLAELEKKAAVDAVTADKLARIEAALDANQRRVDELVLKGRRPVMAHDAPAVLNEHKSAFDGYFRSGNEDGMRALEKKFDRYATSGTADAGFMVPAEIEQEVLRRMAKISPIRSIAGQRTVSSGIFRKPVTSTAATVGWVGDATNIAETDAPIAELVFNAMELYAMPAATQALLEDTAVDMESWLADEVETAFAEQENAAFVNGNGTTQPKGFMQETVIANENWQWGRIGTVKTGVAGDFPASNPGDAILELIYALKASYRQNGTFVMSRKTQSAVRKLKSADGNYLWHAPTVPGGQASLLGFPVVEAEEMPEIANNRKSIAFGDFRRGYLVVDRAGLRVLRDPFTSKPYVLFYTTKRVGGGVQDFDAIKLLNFAA